MITGHQAQRRGTVAHGGAQKGVRPVGRRPARAMRWLLLLAVVAVAIGGAALARREATPRGTLAAEHTTHDFGRVPMAGGLLRASIPIAVDGDALVTALEST